MSCLTSFNVTEFIDARPWGALQRRVAALCAFIAVVDGFDTQIIAYMAPAISTEWGLARGAFGPVFAAGLLGLALGSMSGGAIADRWGRKRVIVLASLFFGAFSLATAWVGELPQMILLRFLTGLGLGAAIPNLIAITAEYAPARNRTLIVTLMFSGFPLGSVAGGILSSVWIPELGWRSLFVLGGLLPIGWAILMVKTLPESPTFLVVSGAPPRRLGELLRRIDPRHHAKAYVLSDPPSHRSSVVALFQDHRSVMTLLLWVTFFMNLLVMYFFVNWLPTLLSMAGYALSRAIQASTAFNVGGIVGGVVLAAIIRRKGAIPVLSITFVVTGVAIAGISRLENAPLLIFPAVFVVGFGVVGAQFCLNALAADLYPTASRSTGVGWALGVGRVGSVLGPLIGGILLGLAWKPNDLVFACLGPALLAAVSVHQVGRQLACRGRDRLAAGYQN